MSSEVGNGGRDGKSRGWVERSGPVASEKRRRRSFQGRHDEWRGRRENRIRSKAKGLVIALKYKKRGQICRCSFKVKERRKLLLKSGLIKSKIAESQNYASVPKTFLERSKY